MTGTLSHRGPDADGFYFDEHVALGHRRLSIIDLDGGVQPMVDTDHDRVTVFNGEIYNYRELRRDLGTRGHHFRTMSDTEVILHAYADRGVHCLEDFNGMFALGLWDPADRTFLAARDRLGEKPFYYHFSEDRGRLIFASELKALLKHPEVSAEMSMPALDDYLAYGYVPADRCIIAGIAKLSPGWRLVWRAGRLTLDSYWNVSSDVRFVSDEHELVDELEQRLRESIRIRLRSDVPLGVFLSGGVDSSAVVALAGQETSGKVKTFSVGFSNRSHNELDYAREVADVFQTDHQELMVEDHNIDVLPDVVYHLDEPMADPSVLPTYYVCREARRHVTVCLSGDGGDELFAGYTRYGQAMRHQRWDRFTRYGIQQLAGALHGVLPRHVRGKGALERMAAGGAARYFAQCCKFTVDERVNLFQPEFSGSVSPNPWLFDRGFDLNNGDPLVTILQCLDQKTYLPDDILTKVDRMSMQNSLEVRVPFLDHTLVEFANRIPPAWKLRHGVGKYIVKKMLSKYLPYAFLNRRKMGFGIPIKHWFRDSLVGYAQDILLSPGTVSAQWIRPDGVRRIVDEHRRGGRDQSRKIWALLVLELWARRFCG